MKIIIEEYPYDYNEVIKYPSVADIPHNCNMDGYIVFNCVGYFFDTKINDCVFVLPKVLLGNYVSSAETADSYCQQQSLSANDSEQIERSERVFGKYNPEKIIDLDKSNVENQDVDFIKDFAVWIYRTLIVYKNKNIDSSIIYEENIQLLGKGKISGFNSLLEIVLSLLKFNQENQNFFFFIFQNSNSGFNIINWNKTINSKIPIVHNYRPLYVDTVDKKRKINFDEELIIIYFSILNYLNDTFGFKAKMNFNIELIKGTRFLNLINGHGRRKLLNIKYKYFSDKAIALWNLCYSFFDFSNQIAANSNFKEYILAKNFNIVFESIIDDLIGDKNFPAGLKEQHDGKKIDHLYVHDDLINDTGRQIYFIGDSKYYKRNTKIGKQSVYKQFTYARNLIQWNLDCCKSNFSDKDSQNVEMIRDTLTEGYNIIPNFFISAKLNKNLDFDDDISKTNKKSFFVTRQFDNRLFDRDTLLIHHYDVNFLFIISLYAKNNELEISRWKSKVRKILSDMIKQTLNDFFDFYIAEPYRETHQRKFILNNFKDLNGKVISLLNNKPYLLLALNSPNSNLDRSVFSSLDESSLKKENDSVIKVMQNGYFLHKFSLTDKDPLKEINDKYVQFYKDYPLGIRGFALVVYAPNLNVERYKNFAVSIGNSSYLNYISAAKESIKFIVFLKDNNTYFLATADAGASIIFGTNSSNCLNIGNSSVFLQINISGSVEQIDPISYGDIEKTYNFSFQKGMDSVILVDLEKHKVI